MYQNIASFVLAAILGAGGSQPAQLQQAAIVQEPVGKQQRTLENVINLQKAEDLPKYLPGGSEYKEGNIPILYFWAEWCGPCRRVTGPVLDAVARENNYVLLIKVNVGRQNGDAGEELCPGAEKVFEQYAYREQGIPLSTLPTTIVFRPDGKPFPRPEWEVPVDTQPYTWVLGTDNRKHFRAELKDLIERAKK